MKKLLLFVLPFLFVGCAQVTSPQAKTQHTEQGTETQQTVQRTETQRTVKKASHHEKCIGHFQFEVLQVLDYGLLTYACEEEYRFQWKLVFMPVQTKGEIYFDKQIIKCPSGKCPIYTDTLRYMSNDEIQRTIAVVQFVEPNFR